MVTDDGGGLGQWPGSQESGKSWAIEGCPEVRQTYPRDSEPSIRDLTSQRLDPRKQCPDQGGKEGPGMDRWESHPDRARGQDSLVSERGRSMGTRTKLWAHG